MARIGFMWTAQCRVCPWTYANVVKSDVDFQVKAHRRQHHLAEVAEAAQRKALEEGEPEWTI